MNKIHKFSLIIFAVFFLFSSSNALAFEVINLPETPVKDDFVVSPARAEIVMKPGESITKYVTVLNRFGSDYNFTITVEDFSPDAESGNPILNENSPGISDFSLKKYVKPDADKFFLRQGSRATIAVDIAVPKSTSAGGRYAVILIGASPKTADDTPTTILARIGSLLLVKVEGSVVEDGQLSSFVFKDRRFLISYKNDGNIHLDPYGVIDIKGVSGGLNEAVQIDPWVILPGSTRSRFLDLSGELPDGEYIAKIMLNRGYGDIIDSKEIRFRLGAVPVADIPGEENPPSNTWYYVVGAIALIFVALGFMFRKKQ